jgi:hypothetical protein
LRLAGAVDDQHEQLNLIPASSQSPPPELAVLVTRRDISRAWGCSLRHLDQLRAQDKLPPPDLMIGLSPRWRVETINALSAPKAEEGGR